MITQDQVAVAYEAMVRGGFTKNDIMNALLRAGVSVETVEDEAEALMTEAHNNGVIRPFANNSQKWTRIS
jgi:hypothetical protein